EALQGFLMVFPRLPRFRCRVVLLNGFLEDEDYLKLIRQSRFALNASYGEGQCLPLMEYLACGKRAVAPCHSALADYINGDVAFTRRSAAAPTISPHDPRIAYRRLRQQIDRTPLRQAYRAGFACYREQPDRYDEMCNAATQRMQQNCSLAVARSRLEAMLND